MTDFYIKKGDTSPSIMVTLKDVNDAIVDLTGASVQFHMADRPNHETTKVNSSAEIIDAEGGKVRYDWGAGDTDIAGKYDAEWEVTFSNGKIETFPSDDYRIIEITEDLA